MKTYVILLRGINVGGKNEVSMAALKKCLEKLGLSDVSTYINSGNVIARSTKSAKELQTEIETELPKRFDLDDEQIKVLALTHAQLKTVVKDRPKGFGDSPAKYHSDAIFLMGIPVAKTMNVFSPREGVDSLWPGKGMIYSQRLSAQRTKSRLNKMMSTPEYKSMTIRSWQTVMKLVGMCEE